MMDRPVRPGAYLGEFLIRAGPDWHHSGWDFRKVVAAEPAKVHLDVQFTPYRIDNSAIGRFRSLWIRQPSKAGAGP